MRGLILGALLLAPAVAGAEGMKDLQACMQANVPSAGVVEHALHLSTTDSQGQVRNIEGRIATTSTKTKSGELLLRSTLRFRSPEAFDGAAYLIREIDDKADSSMYIYLPAVRSVKAVMNKMGDGALLGTDFSYRDFKQLQYAFTGTQVTLAGEDRVDGRRALELNLTPRQGGDWQYSLIKMWVEPRSCVPVKAQYLVGDKVVKELSVPPSALRQDGKLWYATQMRMKDLESGSQTVLSLSDITAPKPLSPELFDVQTFYLPGG